MPNLRVVYDNAADRATLTASTTAGGLSVTSLQSNFKNDIWRSTDTTATLTLNWASAELVGMVALAFASLTSTATFRVRCYFAAADSTPAIDVTVNACSASEFSNFGWGTQVLGVNGYAYGGGAYGVAWFTPGAYQKIVIDITDLANTLGYIEAARLVAGTYWASTYAAEAGAEVSVVDTSKQERTDAGDLRTERGTMHKKLSFDLNFLTTSDRNALWNILRGNGMYTPMFVSVTPESTDDTVGEQIYQVYGKLTRSGSIKYQLLNQSSSQLEIEEM